MGVDAATFRSVLGQWPSGVTVVTTVVDGGWHGMTASSFSSVSLDPPLVSVCLAKAVWTHGLVAASGVFAVNILAKDQASLGMLFAGQRPEVADRFEGLAARSAVTGAPVLTEALGWLDCRVVQAYDGGDHTIFVGEVVDADTPRLTAPLLFHSRAWGQFADLLPDEAQAEDTGIVAALLARHATGEEVATVVGGIRDCGVRVRLADLAATPHPSTRDLAAAGAVRVDASTASVRVAHADQVALAVGLGAGHVDVAASSDDPEASAVLLREVVSAARTAGVSVGISVPDAFGNPDLTPLFTQLDALTALVPDQIVLGDAGAAATPLSVRQLLQDAVSRTKPVPLALALGDHAGLGLANALTAMKSGVRRFEATLGGVDERVALEDLLHLVGSLEVVSAVDPRDVRRVARGLESVWGGALPSRTYRIDAEPDPGPSDGPARPDLTLDRIATTAGGPA